MKITLTENAAARIKVLAGDDAAKMLRLTVSGGGCSGFQYGFALDNTKASDDHIFEQHGVRVVVDEMSLELMDESQIDYVEELVGAYFRVTNPKATSTCGCGSSFAV